jgi:hypothetical protein
MFTPQERTNTRSELLSHAAKDKWITRAAITGSAAAALKDQWSDVDLAFGVSLAANLQAVLADWTRYMYNEHLACHHLDVLSGAWTYRVFILPNTLQVDLAFVVETEFRALGPTFRLVFGETNEPRQPSPPSAGHLIGMAWLFALHARSSIARQKPWQAEYMISGLRDNALALACLALGVPSVHARGIDLLPLEVTSQFLGSIVQSLDTDELSRALQNIVGLLAGQIRDLDAELAMRLQPTLDMLADIR